MRVCVYKHSLQQTADNITRDNHMIFTCQRSSSSSSSSSCSSLFLLSSPLLSQPASVSVWTNACVSSLVSTRLACLTGLPLCSAVSVVVRLIRKATLSFLFFLPVPGSALVCAAPPSFSISSPPADR